MPVHVYGNICDVEGIETIAQKYGLKVIYDACHCFGETYKGQGVANFGDVSCFSFHATKVFNTIEGGAVCYRNQDFGKRLRDLRNFGIHSEESIQDVGANAKMNEFSAAMGLCNLRHIEEELAKRTAVYERYMSHFEGIRGLKLQKCRSDIKYNHAYFPVMFEKEFGATRNEVYDKLASSDIFARKYFYPMTSVVECYNKRFDVNDTPVALHASKHVLTLPMYSDLEINDVDKICKIVKSCTK